MYLDIQELIWNCHLYWAWNFFGARHQIAPNDKEMDEGMLIELKCNIVMTSVYLIGTWMVSYAKGNYGHFSFKLSMMLPWSQYSLLYQLP